MRALRILGACVMGLSTGRFALAADEPSTTIPVFRQYCYGCHGKASMGGISLEKLTAQASVGESYRQWQKVVAALEEKRMPPEKMPQPSDAERVKAAQWVRTRLNEFAQKHAGDPGKVTMRRLTSGEYGYTIQDLTGIEFRVDGDFVADTVGGEGFTNFGDVQFVDDGNLERYLRAAKTIADHAVVGSGPLSFYEDPGKSGFELSAIHRIQQIYEQNGFRAVAGEGGKAYGMERYAKAFYVCWRYQHREALGEGNRTLEEIALREGSSARFVRHLWTVLHQPNPTHPTTEIVERWQKLPAPGGAEAMKAVRAGCTDMQKFIVDYPRWLLGAGGVAEGGQGDERALIITEEALTASPTNKFRFILRNRPSKTGRVFLSVLTANEDAKGKPVVIWKNATVRFRSLDREAGPSQPLSAVLTEESRTKLNFGKLPNGQATLDPQEFAMATDSKLFFDVIAPEKAGVMEMQIEAVMAPDANDDAVLRVVIADREDMSRGGAPSWALLANPKSPTFRVWKDRVLQYAANIPQTSHGEATPSDKDPIPAPYNNTYNQPERDIFHMKVKYYRTDRFLVEKVLDDATRVKLDQAWADLYASFEYHDSFLRFVADKYKLNLKDKGLAQLTPAEIEALPAEPRGYVKSLRAEYDWAHKAQRAAQSGHVEDCVTFASRAWRRPLTDAEKKGLRSFYFQARETGKMEHDKAVRALVARILVAPAFLYRLEQVNDTTGLRALGDWEVASRLSYFLWSSMPDEELRRAAGAGELSDPQQVERQVKRMLADAKARRMATEFFGQWLGFYRFDQYKGVDTGRFPEFTEKVKAAMYDEAVTFFEHVIRKDRPVREILFADYTFLNKDLAKFYGVTKPVAAANGPELVENANEFQRGGLLRLGAVLTATSAPLRTSPVKRGDWVLRRLLNTPTPPPPANAGSIPADEKAFGGLSLREKLAAHQRNPSCAGCHTRIDPLGFPLERYDAVGRWRDKYPDGQPIHDSSTTADRANIAGVNGLIEYMRSREAQILGTLSQRLVGYALGRTVQLSDQALVDKLTQAAQGGGFSKLVTEIATSKQFRYRRDGDRTAPGPQIAKAATQEGGR